MRILTGGGTALALALSGAATLSGHSALQFARYDHPANAAPRTIVSADFNRDGFPDVALGGTGRASVGILFHHGLEDGDEGQKFGPIREVVVGGGPFELAAADINRDGLIDIAVANADSNALTILLNDATHQFSRVLHTSVPENPRGLAIADFNGDAIPDVAVTKYMGTTLDVLYGRGDGTFPTRRSHPAPVNAQGVVAADLNNDGRKDVALVSATGVVSTYLLDAAGASLRADYNRSAYGWNVITAGDFNRDGAMDLAYASTSGSVVEVMFHRPDRSTVFGAAMPVAASPRGLETADMDGDGVLDLVTAGRAESTVTVLLRDHATADTFQSQYTRHDVAAGNGARDLALVDFSGDGRTDILTANEYAHSTTVLGRINEWVRAGFAFDRMSIPPYYNNDMFAVADFNRNGRPDLVRPDHVLLDGTTVSRVPVLGKAAAAADFNADGHADVIYVDTTRVRTFFGDGAGGFAEGRSWLPFGRPWYLRAADMNTDGKTDLVLGTELSETAGTVEVWMNRGDGTFFIEERIELLRPRWIEVADINVDASMDVGVATVSGIAVFAGNGTGNLLPQATFGEGVVRNGFKFGNVTPDGFPDLVVADGTTNEWGPGYGPIVTVARGDGRFGFETIQQIDTSVATGFEENVGLVLGDLTSDGILDIFTTGMNLLEGNGSGQFGAPAPFNGYGSFHMQLVDMNRDGLLDIAGGNENFGEGVSASRIWLNTRRQPFENRAPTNFDLPSSVTVQYGEQFRDTYEDDDLLSRGYFSAYSALDPDTHALRYRWTLADGTILSPWSAWQSTLPPGTYEVTLTVDDYRGGVSSDRMSLTITPHKETVIHAGASDQQSFGAWRFVADSTAASNYRQTHPDAGAPKLQAPLATPTNYVDYAFVADPTQQYKLWLRMKADGDSWANDSVFVQFSGAKDAAGNSVYGIGSTSALAVNLEECSGCGLSGWGWEDDGWGAPDRHGVTVRFPQGGVQILRIQTREDGVSIDQIVISAEKYLTQRPGAPKNDTTKLPRVGPYLDYFGG